MQEFFSFNFPLRELFFCTSPAPLPPNKFSNGPSLTVFTWEIRKFWLENQMVRAIAFGKLQKTWDVI